MTRFLDSSDLLELDEVTASIIEYGHGSHSHVCRLHRKLHAQLFQPGILFLNIINSLILGSTRFLVPINRIFIQPVLPALPKQVDKNHQHDLPNF